ncbi:metal-dependent hydrolase [Rhodanobacter sp. FW510-R12]|nr:metal-dependent hydrolase [Rhodanobacter sp. FW104-R8]KZC27331.1 metal-dependent hydrolase [Rhodanobacter sp. FW510-T8]KZC30164.1 metal-dependent hydrolase [Rhodanobacter sp. FW510-R10]
MLLHEAGWSIQYGEEIIRFAVRRQPQRRRGSIAIHVEPSGCVVVDAPADASRPTVLAAVRKRARWVHEHLASFRRRYVHVLPREYVSGEAVMYLGRRYRLKVIPANAADAGVKLCGSHLEVRCVEPTPTSVREAMEAWYRARARSVFAARVDDMLATIRWKQLAPRMRLQAMKTQWGSCSPTGKITLNPWLVKAPRDCIDYVILHELCHLKEHNHSPRFFKLLDRHMPTWRQRKARLDELAEVILNL